MEATEVVNVVEGTGGEEVSVDERYRRWLRSAEHFRVAGVRTGDPVAARDWCLAAEAALQCAHRLRDL